MVFFYCFFAAFLSAVVSLISGADLSAWTLQSSMPLIAVLYSVGEVNLFFHELAAR